MIRVLRQRARAADGERGERLGIDLLLVHRAPPLRRLARVRMRDGRSSKMAKGTTLCERVPVRARCPYCEVFFDDRVRCTDSVQLEHGLTVSGTHPPVK